MNATTTPDKPASSLLIDDGSPIYLVAVKIWIRDEPAAPPFFPAVNFVGSWILFAAFKAALDIENLRVKAGPQLRTGMLNHSHYCLRVTDVPRSLNALGEILEESRLRTVSTLLVFDVREEFFRPYGHDGARAGAGFSLDTMIAQAANEELFKASIARILEQNPPPPTPPGPGDEPNAT